MLRHVELAVYDNTAVVELGHPKDRGGSRVSIIECDDALFHALWWDPRIHGVEVDSEFLEVLTLEDIPITVTHSTSEFLWEGVQALDIIRVPLQEDLVIGIERLDKGIVVDVVLLTRFAVYPSLFHPRMSLPSRVGGSEEIGSHSDLRSTQG